MCVEILIYDIEEPILIKLQKEFEGKAKAKQESVWYKRYTMEVETFDEIISILNKFNSEEIETHLVCQKDFVYLQINKFEDKYGFGTQLR